MWLRTYLSGSLRMGTPINDLAPRNMSPTGAVFDPAIHPVHEGLLILTAAGAAAAATATEEAK
jgi:hypothetical protein